MVVVFAWAWAAVEIGTGPATGAVIGAVAAWTYREEIMAAGRRVAGVEEPDAEERARQRYVRGEIGVAELERELDHALSDGRQAVADRAERAAGVGPVLSESLAEEFPTPRSVARAEPEEIAERVTGVGPDRAREIADRFD